MLTSASRPDRARKSNSSRDCPTARLDVTLRKRPDTTVEFSLALRGERG